MPADINGPTGFERFGSLCKDPVIIDTGVIRMNEPTILSSDAHKVAAPALVGSAICVNDVIPCGSVSWRGRVTAIYAITRCISAHGADARFGVRQSRRRS
jgi:hypothetical protein